jgi:toxin CcdB
MAQFDVHRIGDGAFVLDCQADSLSHLTTRVVAPLMPRADVPPATSRLHPVLQFDGEAFVLATHLLTAIPVRELGPAIASLADERYTVVAALDMVITGY